MLHHYYLLIYSHLVHGTIFFIKNKHTHTSFNLSQFRNVLSFKCKTKTNLAPPPPHTHTHTPTPRSQILTVPQWFFSSITVSGSQIINCNYHFCNNYSFILLPSPILLFPRTASVSFKVVPMEYSTSVKEANTKVIVTKMVILIDHLAVMANSRSLWNCKIHFAIRQ